MTDEKIQKDLEEYFDKLPKYSIIPNSDETFSVMVKLQSEDKSEYKYVYFDNVKYDTKEEAQKAIEELMLVE
jgi:hypothetical protein